MIHKITMFKNKDSVYSTYILKCKGWNKEKFLWLPTRRYLCKMGHLVPVGYTWLAKVTLTRNITLGWIHVVEKDS